MTEDSWEIVRLAGNWRDGRLPRAGGVEDQAAWTVAAVEIVLTAWSKLRAARDSRDKD